MDQAQLAEPASYVVGATRVFGVSRNRVKKPGVRGVKGCVRNDPEVPGEAGPLQKEGLMSVPERGTDVYRMSIRALEV